LDGEGNRREFRLALALTTRTTAENDDDDEKDWEMTLNRDKRPALPPDTDALSAPLAAER